MTVEIDRLLENTNPSRDELMDYIGAIEAESSLTPEELDKLAEQGFSEYMTEETRPAMFWFVVRETLEWISLNGHSPNGRLRELEQLGDELARAEDCFQRRKLWDSSRAAFLKVSIRL